MEGRGGAQRCRLPGACVLPCPLAPCAGRLPHNTVFSSLPLLLFLFPSSPLQGGAVRDRARRPAHQGDGPEAHQGGRGADGAGEREREREREEKVWRSAGCWCGSTWGCPFHAPAAAAAGAQGGASVPEGAPAQAPCSCTHARPFAACLRPLPRPQADVYVAALDVPGAKRLIPQVPPLQSCAALCCALPAACSPLYCTTLCLWRNAAPCVLWCRTVPVRRSSPAPAPLHGCLHASAARPARHAAARRGLSERHGAGDRVNQTEHLRVGKLQLLSTPKTS